MFTIPARVAIVTTGSAERSRKYILTHKINVAKYI